MKPTVAGRRPAAKAAPRAVARPKPAPAKAKPAAAKPKAAPYHGQASVRSTRAAAERGRTASRGSAQASRAAGRGKGGGLDLPKFASEVSRNYANGVARVGQSLSGVKMPQINGPKMPWDMVGSGTGVDNAMRTGADQSNPLHRILRK